MRRLLVVAGLSVLFVTMTACRSHPPPPEPKPLAAAADAGPKPPPNVDAKVLTAADKARGTKSGSKDAHDKLAAGAKGDELWAATYVYAADGDDPKLLAPLLRHEDATIRVLAAGGLVRLGDPAAFKVLVDETGNTAVFRGSEPPEAIGEIAALMLSIATREKLAVNAGPATKAAWGEWYATRGVKLTFDAKKGWRAL